jgi:muramoyltetrapeptide carboxypeptidase
MVPTCTRSTRPPPVLGRGGTIGLVSTSSSASHTCPRRFHRATVALQRLGYHVRPARHVCGQASLPWSSGTPGQRASDLHELFRDDTVDAIMLTVGGEVTNGILELMDWELIRAYPKLVIGYSDATVLQAALWHMTAIGAVYGPALLPQFGEPGGVDGFTLRAFETVVSKDDAAGRLPSSRYWITDRCQWDASDNHPRLQRSAPSPRTIRRGTAEGHMLPANLGALLRLAGTPWFPRIDGAILCLEVSDMCPAADVHAGLMQLKQLGAFKAATGLVFGRFPPEAECDHITLTEILADTIDSKLPIAVDFSFGHTDPILSLPWGVSTALNADSGTPSLSLLEPAVTHSRRAVRPF